MVAGFGIMENLISNSQQDLILKKKVMLIITLQTGTSSIFSGLCYSISNISDFITSNYWIFYTAISVYILLSCVFLIFSEFKKPSISYAFLIGLLLCSVSIDTSSSSSESPGTLRAFIFIFADALGIALYTLVATKEFQAVWAFVGMVITNSVAFVVFLVLDFSYWQTLIIIFAICFLFGVFLLMIVCDFKERYNVKVQDYCHGTVVVYIDILILPYLISKFRYIREKPNHKDLN
jgi:hypothetical protein